MKTKYIILLFIAMLAGGPLLYSAEVVLSDVPIYLWWYGCSPTSSGMLIGFWDAQGYDMVQGDMSVYNQDVKDFIASQDHINDFWGVDDPAPHSDNSLADFMDTSKDPLADGSTTVSKIDDGIVAFAAWDNPDTVVLNESYNFSSSINYTNEYAGGGWDFDFEEFKNEIDAGRPMLLSTNVLGGGHTIIGFGYQDNAGMDYVAIHDTWGNAGSPVDWVGNSSDPASAKMESGLEWWPWITDTAQTFYIKGGIDFTPGVPEPSCIVLFLTGLIFLIKKQRVQA